MLAIPTSCLLPAEIMAQLGCPPGGFILDSRQPLSTDRIHRCHLSQKQTGVQHPHPPPSQTSKLATQKRLPRGPPRLLPKLPTSSWRYRGPAGALSGCHVAGVCCRTPPPQPLLHLLSPDSGGWACQVARQDRPMLLWEARGRRKRRLSEAVIGIGKRNGGYTMRWREKKTGDHTLFLISNSILRFSQNHHFLPLLPAPSRPSSSSPASASAPSTSVASW